MLDRVPYWLLMSLLFVPGPLIIAMFTGAGGLVMVLAPIGGAIIGLGVARALLREHKASVRRDVGRGAAKADEVLTRRLRV